MKSTTWLKLLILMAPLGLLMGITYGCGSSKPGIADLTVTPPPGGGGPCTEGQKQVCYELLGVHNGVRSCLTGTQVCVGGRWSACSGAEEALIEMKASQGVTPAYASINGMPTNGRTISPPDDPGLSTRQLTNPGPACPDSGTSDAYCTTACTNPCDPACVGWTEDGGLQLDGNFSTDGISALPGTNPGFTNKLLQDDTQTGTECDKYGGGSEGDNAIAACQADHWCANDHFSAPSDSNCKKFGFGQTYGAGTEGSTCLMTDGGTGPDFTIGTPCNLPGTGDVVSVCNRGSGAAPATATVTIGIHPPGSILPYLPTPGSCFASGQNDCSVSANSLAPGDCVWATGCSISGNKVMYANSTSPVAECQHSYAGVGGMSSARIQLGCENNFTAFNSSQVGTCSVNYAPKTVTQLYTAVCPPGTHAQWNKLAWNGVTPVGTTITFSVRTAPLVPQPDGGAIIGTYTGSTTVGSAPSPDPAICLMAGPTPCPKDLYIALTNDGGLPKSNATNEVLELTIQMNPAGSLAPVLNTWQLTYSCPGAE